jgi:hypothetical protein
MSITLAVGATSVTLNPDLYWSDEHNWWPVEQTSQRTITGAIVVSSAERIAGRPITLEPEDDSSGWMPFALVAQLRNWAAEPGQVMVLTLRGTARDVIFRHQDGPGLEPTPVVHYSDVDDADFYRVTLRLMEI